MYPALVGNDIGCGCALWQTDLAKSKVKLDKLDRQIGNIDGPVDDAEWSAIERFEPALAERREALAKLFRNAGLAESHLRSGGNVGGGNHFAELQVIDQIADGDAVAAAGLNSKALQLVVHSGSRGLGQAILRNHVDAFGHRGLVDGTSESEAYLAKHDAAVRFAEYNRALVAARILLRLRAAGIPVLNVHHNMVERETVGVVQGWLHRKGANPTTAGLVVLPGSRDAYTYLLEPIVDAGASSLYSLAHGAGRKWLRTDCKDRLFRIASPDQLARTSMGGRVICNDRSLIYEEAPQAYKNVDDVLESLVGAGLVRVLARSKPVLTYKTRGECC
jgi:release factor H-coupled RctB family protein